jgi:hypothetical protein
MALGMPPCSARFRSRPRLASIGINQVAGCSCTSPLFAFSPGPGRGLGRFSPTARARGSGRARPHRRSARVPGCANSARSSPPAVGEVRVSAAVARIARRRAAPRSLTFASSPRSRPSAAGSASRRSARVSPGRRSATAARWTGCRRSAVTLTGSVSSGRGLRGTDVPARDLADAAGLVRVPLDATYVRSTRRGSTEIDHLRARRCFAQLDEVDMAGKHKDHNSTKATASPIANDELRHG